MPATCRNPAGSHGTAGVLAAAEGADADQNEGDPPGSRAIRSLPIALRRPGLAPVVQRLLHAAGPAALLLLLLPLQGCAGLPLQPRQTLHLLVVPTEGMDWMRHDDAGAHRTLEPLLKAFRRLQPNVGVDISFQSQDGLEAKLRSSSSRGLAPDLLILRSPQAVSMLQRGLIDPLPGGDAAVQRLLGLIMPSDLKRLRTVRGLAGLPVFNEFSLACYDRWRLRQPPKTLAELLELAASGRNVGLSVDPIGLWWTAGALGAQRVMAPILTGNPVAGQAETPAQQRALLSGWLTWLRQAALQSRVEIASGPRELTVGLESGQLAWIPCFSLTLTRLDRSLGGHLGVAPLPSGPGGPASPFSTTEAWALGRDSSPSQRRLALQLMALSLDPLIQRESMLVSRTLLPANRFVPIPVSSSGRLGALDAAKGQFQQGSPLLSQPFSIDRMQALLPHMEAVVMDVMVGLTPPQQGAAQLLELRPRSAAAR